MMMPFFEIARTVGASGLEAGERQPRVQFGKFSVWGIF